MSTKSFSIFWKNKKMKADAVTQSFPSPSISCVLDLTHVPEISPIASADHYTEGRQSCASSSALEESKALKDVHVSAQLMEDFLELARENTNKNLETCGIIGAFQEERVYYVTLLIIPKQESTSDSCQAKCEEEIFFILNERSLFPVGWIHTHPSQSCFMSSIDLHTQYSYQAMVPEAVAIVMAPTDKSREYGIFRICEPGGMSVLRECKESGYHPHNEPDDGSPIYHHCTNVFVNHNLRLEIFDLRC